MEGAGTLKYLVWRKMDESCDIFPNEQPVCQSKKITVADVQKLNIPVCKNCGVNLQRTNFGKETPQNYCDACIDDFPTIHVY
jgi:hypothetical protein